jgi:deaminated glutathione amidase
MRLAAVQLTTTPDKRHNLETAERLVRAAAADRARFVVLPEMFSFMGVPEDLPAGMEALDGPTMSWARGLARDLGIWLVAGSILERADGKARAYNTSCLVNPEGEVRAIYRKIHLFDCDVPGGTFRESDTILPGKEIVLTKVDGVPLGMSICYDLRFPELYRILTLAGARLIVAPAAFTERTGRDHWEVLLRARAIENQVFMVAAGLVGPTPAGLRTFGRSMIVDPWGVVLAQAPDRETYVTAELDFAAQDTMRTQLPCLLNRRPETYLWPKPG